MRLKIKVAIGQIFNRLTVIKELYPVLDKWGGITVRKYLCLCSCGKEKIVSKGNLTNGNVKSCGCLYAEVNSPRGYYYRYPELYSKYKSAKGRCNNPKNAGYKNYGGRGIKFLFTGGFIAFADYCLSVGWKSGLQIDRINNDGNYEPGNIRFVTQAENNQNTRVVGFHTAFGNSKTISQWAQDPRCIVSRRMLASRLQLGWPIEKALTLTKHKHQKFS